jgi:hypothetical protein
MPHSMCEMRSVVLKTVISVTRIILRSHPKLQGVIFVIAFGLLFWYHLKLVRAAARDACELCFAPSCLRGKSPEMFPL